MAFDLTRRRLIGGIGLLLCAPTIVRAASLMPVKAVPSDLWAELYSDEAPPVVAMWEQRIGAQIKGIHARIAAGIPYGTRGNPVLGMPAPPGYRWMVA